MTRSGHDYVSPYAAGHDSRWKRDQAPTERRLTVAVADVRCQKRVRYLPTLDQSVWGGYCTTTSSAYQVSEPVNGYCNTWSVDGVLTNLRMVEDNPSSSTNYCGAWHGYPVAGN
ncbi:hypothetical protein [Streptomyces sp. NPDC020996]|uniref:hypothetical protein n=1 Tax=Streptomyces sp. NPDC020996 TaxID=3154791 RepID=UPI0033DCB74F